MRIVRLIIPVLISFWVSPYLYSQYNFNVKRPLSETGHKIVFASYSKDGRYIITTGTDSSIIIWNTDRLTIYRTLTGLSARPNVAVISPEKMVVMAGGKDNKISLWDLSVMPPVISRTFEGHKGQIKSLDSDPEGKYMASGSADGSIRIWDIFSTNLIYELKGHKGDVNSVKFSPDGSMLASGGADGAIMLWNVERGSQIISVNGHKGWVRDIDFSSDGNVLASCGDDKLINIWQLPDLKKTITLSGHKNWVQSIDFSPDGKALLSGSRDRLIFLWDVTSGKILRQSEKQSQMMISVDISPVRSDFISACYNSEELEIWAISGLDEAQWQESSFNKAGLKISGNIVPDNNSIIQEQKAVNKSAGIEQPGESMIEIFTPVAPDGKYVHDKESIFLVGRVTDPDGIISFRINGTLISLAEGGIFQHNVTLSKGENEIKLVAINNNAAMDQKILVIECTSRIAESQGQKVPVIMQGRYCALLIGVSEYIDPNIADLEFPVKDAEKLYNVLTSNYTFEKQDIILLNNPTYADMTRVFDSLAAVLTSDDNLLIFYAGHGKWDEKNKVGSWFPSDASRTSTSHWFRNSVLRDYLSSIAAKHTLLIADACFSGSIFKSRAAFTEPSQGVEKLYSLLSRKAMTSGILQEVPDESAFLKYLVNRLSDNSEKFLPSEELFIRFKSAVMDNSPNVPQFGVIQNVGDEGGDFIFIKR